MTIRSFQTPDEKQFAYNPFSGAEIYIYPKDRDPRNPRIFKLEPAHPKKHGKGVAFAAQGKIEVRCIVAGNVKVTVNGKPTERYTIVYPKTRSNKRRVFQAY